MAKVNPEVLKQIRDKKGISQQDLAERAKINVQTISRLERGEQGDTRASTLKKIGRALGIDPSVLTGNSPMPEITPMPQKSASSVRLSRQADNALFLVAQRYFVQPWQVMEMAPLLFCWAAEMSLRQRTERIEKIEQACERARELESEMGHLPVPNFTYSEEKIAAETDSIRSHDIFGACIDESGFSNDFFPDYGDLENPFATFLVGAIGGIGGVAEFEEFSPIDYPVYRVCPEEALQLVDGDESLAEDVLNGSVALREMPKELAGIFADTEQRVNWIRAEAEDYRKRSYGIEAQKIKKGALK